MRTRNIVILMFVVTMAIIATYRLFSLPRFDAILQNDAVWRWVGIIVISACFLGLLVIIPLLFFQPVLQRIWKRIFRFRTKRRQEEAIFGTKRRQEEAIERFILWTQELPPRPRAAAEKILHSLTRQQLGGELMSLPPNKWALLLADWDRGLINWAKQHVQEWSQEEKEG